MFALMGMDKAFGHLNQSLVTLLLIPAICVIWYVGYCVKDSLLFCLLILLESCLYHVVEEGNVMLCLAACIEYLRIVIEGL